MGTRRANGEGCITHFRKGFRGKLCHNGKCKYVYGKTKKDVAQKLQELRLSIAKGIDIFAPQLKFGELLEKYLSDYSVNIRPATRQNYEGYLQRIREQPISQKSVSQLRTDDFQQLANYLSNKGRIDGAGGLSAKTIHNYFNFISGAMDMAVANGLISHDPSRFAKLPKQHVIEKEILTTSEVDLLINAATGNWAIGVYILAKTGLRSGECLGLRADCFCSEKGIYYLDVKHSLRRVKDFTKTGSGPKSHLALTDLKTSYSQRKIPLSADVAERIQAHIKALEERAACSYGLFNDNPFLVCNEIGNAVDPSSFRKYFNKVVKAAGLPNTITQHSLRHTRASHLIQAGCSAKAVSLYLGHSEAGFTLSRYVHFSLQDLNRELSNHNSKNDF